MSEPPERRPNGTFEKGQTGNPKGRPKGAAGFTTVFNRKRDEAVEIKVGKDQHGKAVFRRMSRMEAWIENTWNKAVNGDAKATASLLSIMRATGQLQPEQQPEEQLDDNAADVLKRMIQREVRKRGDGDAS